jgi:hypothetical protein
MEVNKKLLELIKEVLSEEKTKRDRCLRIADKKFDKPSAYKSGAVVRCRKGDIWKNLKEEQTSLQIILDKIKTYKIPYKEFNQKMKVEWIPMWKEEYSNDIAKINELVARHLLYQVAEDLVGGVNEINFKNESKNPTNHFQMEMYLDNIILFTGPFIYVDDKHNVIAKNTKILVLNEDYDDVGVLKEAKELNIQDLAYQQIPGLLEKGIKYELAHFRGFMKSFYKWSGPKDRNDFFDFIENVKGEIKRVPLSSIKPSQFDEDYKNPSSEYEAEEFQKMLNGEKAIEDHRKEDFYPILVNKRDNKIIDGNHRHYALSAINSPYAVVLYVDVPKQYLNEENNPQDFFLDIPKFNYPRTLEENLWSTLNEITLNPNNAAEIEGDEFEGEFKVGDIEYTYFIDYIDSPYGDESDFYSVAFDEKYNTSKNIPTGNAKENYIKILSTMYKIILNFMQKQKPEYIGIASMDNMGSKNYHAIYANLTDNKSNRIPGYFRKDVNLPFNTPQGKGRMVVLKRKNANTDLEETIKKTIQEDESLHKWFKRQGTPGKEGGWVDCNAPIRKDGEITGYKPCGRKEGEKRSKYPSCRPTAAKCKDPGKGKKWGKTK